MSRCAACGRELKPDDIGATRKFISRGASEFYCIPCLAKHLGISESFLRDKIEYFRSQGCTLFCPSGPDCGKKKEEPAESGDPPRQDP